MHEYLPLPTILSTCPETTSSHCHYHSNSSGSKYRNAKTNLPLFHQMPWKEKLDFIRLWTPYVQGPSPAPMVCHYARYTVNIYTTCYTLCTSHSQHTYYALHTMQVHYVLHTMFDLKSTYIMHVTVNMHVTQLHSRVVCNTTRQDKFFTGNNGQLTKWGIFLKYISPSNLYTSLVI